VDNVTPRRKQRGLLAAPTSLWLNASSALEGRIRWGPGSSREPAAKGL